MNLIQQTFSAFMPTQIVFGLNAVKQKLPEDIRNEGVSKVLLVADSGLVKTGMADEISNVLISQGVGVFRFSDVEPNPTVANVAKGKEMYLQNNCQFIVALGGGSVMDAAKAIAVSVANPGDILDYKRGGKIVKGPLPGIFTIPTTAGTGSEVTSVAVITSHEKHRKFVIATPLIAPNKAFIDPAMTFSLPRHIIAATGMDALVHAIEAYTSNRSHPVSDAFALQAIKMIREYLPASYADPTNHEAKAQMLLASTIAGYAFSLSGTALVHSLSHPMSAWFHVPHGLANAILLPYVIEYNLVANYGKYAEIAKIFAKETRPLSKYKAAENLVDELKAFAHSLNIPRDFGYLKVAIDSQMIDRLADDAMDDRGTIPNNPRKPEKADVVELYRKVFPQYKEI